MCYKLDNKIYQIRCRYRKCRITFTAGTCYNFCMRAALHDIAKKLLAPGKGILAADESDSTCAKRFDKYGIEKTPEMRRRWRELLFGTEGIERGLSGVILFDETIRQSASDGTPFAKFLKRRGILPGIKVDQKTEPFNKVQNKPLPGSPEEEVTNGLDGLPARLQEYVKLGAEFTKWRAIIRIGNGLPTKECLRENATRLAAFAKKSQAAGLTPIIEPEVLLDGAHTLARSEEVLTETLHVVFEEVQHADVNLSELILKSSMALPGKDSGEIATPAKIAETTLRAFSASVPKKISGIVFLSGGQTPKEATVRLNEIVKTGKEQNAPWRITFSYSRALQDPVLKEWSGRSERMRSAQEIFKRRVEETSAASEGKYSR